MTKLPVVPTSLLCWLGIFGLALLTGCTAKETPAPALAGPSTFALSVSLQAVPDSILQDGASQSVITIEALGPNGQPARALTLRADMQVNGITQDFGTLSARTIVTGDDGRARVTYTAPPAPLESVGSGTLLTVRFSPIGTDATSQMSREVNIRLLPRGIILPPAGTLAPAFVYSPTQVLTFVNTTFDAALTKDDLGACGSRCTYTWNFGDGGTGAGITALHEFRSPGSYIVTLRVANARGTTETTSQTVTVSAGTAPTASFTFSPSGPAVSQDIFFTAEASRASGARNIVSYEWNFGSGRTAEGITTVKRYDTAGTYTVTLTVTDDANQKGTVTQQVAVGGGTATGIAPVLTFSPTTPLPNTNVNFDASASSGPSPIVEYLFNFGDGTVETVGTSSPIRTHQFTAGTYVVRVTMRDSAGRTATTTRDVAVGVAATIVPVLTFSPTTPLPNTNVNFDASASNGPSPIVDYRFNFGDGTVETIGTTSPTRTHQFIAGTYVVSVTMRDSGGRFATTTVSVTVAP